MNRTSTVGLLIVIAAVIVLMSCGPATPSFLGSVLEEPVPVPDFVLTDQEGQPYRMSDQLGQVVLLFFGYTSCPDVCPTTLATWRRVYEMLGDDADSVEFVFVTVDPQRDTAERLGLHVHAFNPNFVGLTGDQDDLELVYRIFDVFYEVDESSQSALGYLVNHTATTFVVDQEGEWRLRLPYGTPAEDIVHDIKELLE